MSHEILDIWSGESTVRSITTTSRSWIEYPSGHWWNCYQTPHSERSFVDFQLVYASTSTVRPRSERKFVVSRTACDIYTEYEVRSTVDWMWKQKLYMLRAESVLGSFIVSNSSPPSTSLFQHHSLAINTCPASWKLAESTIVTKSANAVAFWTLVLPFSLQDESDEKRA